MGVDSSGMGKGFVVVSSSTKAGLVVGHSSSTGKGFVVVSSSTKTGLVVGHSSSGKVWSSSPPPQKQDSWWDTRPQRGKVLSSSPPSQKQDSWCGTRLRERFGRRLLLHKSRTRGGTLVLGKGFVVSSTKAGMAMKLSFKFFSERWS